MTAENASPRVNFEWMKRELDRLEQGKADKGYVKQIEKAVDSLRQSVDKDITGVHDIAGAAKNLAEEHPCLQEEKLSAMENTIKFWNAWFIRALVGFITFLLTIGGLWLWSYFDLSKTVTDTKEEAMSTSMELQTTVVKIQKAQEEQQKSLQRIEIKDHDAQKEQLAAIVAAVKEAMKKR